MVVHKIQSRRDFDNATDPEDSSLMVLECWATWCAPSSVVSPIIEKYSEDMPKVRFYMMDVDELADVAEKNGARAMPTVILFKDGQKVDQVIGANPPAIDDAIRKHS